METFETKYKRTQRKLGRETHMKTKLLARGGGGGLVAGKYDREFKNLARNSNVKI